jgi:hypothetical protein
MWPILCRCDVKPKTNKKILMSLFLNFAFMFLIISIVSVVVNCIYYMYLFIFYFYFFIFIIIISFFILKGLASDLYFKKMHKHVYLTFIDMVTCILCGAKKWTFECFLNIDKEIDLYLNWFFHSFVLLYCIQYLISRASLSPLTALVSFFSTHDIDREIYVDCSTYLV